ncbi:MAG: hypothetical protein BWY66_00633 [bacterium ADurb.Bin374]|nr:MAG: hypothetical protein BWY66_00633 [bacterium ADurb.Bin374]
MSPEDKRQNEGEPPRDADGDEQQPRQRGRAAGSEQDPPDAGQQPEHQQDPGYGRQAGLFDGNGEQKQSLFSIRSNDDVLCSDAERIISARKEVPLERPHHRLRKASREAARLGLHAVEPADLHALAMQVGCTPLENGCVPYRLLVEKYQKPADLVVTDAVAPGPVSPGSSPPVVDPQELVPPVDEVEPVGVIEHLRHSVKLRPVEAESLVPGFAEGFEHALHLRRIGCHTACKPSPAVEQPEFSVRHGQPRNQPADIAPVKSRPGSFADQAIREIVAESFEVFFVVRQGRNTLQNCVCADYPARLHAVGAANADDIRHSEMKHQQKQRPDSSHAAPLRSASGHGRDRTSTV